MPHAAAGAGAGSSAAILSSAQAYAAAKREAVEKASRVRDSFPLEYSDSDFGSPFSGHLF